MFNNSSLSIFVLQPLLFRHAPDNDTIARSTKRHSRKRETKYLLPFLRSVRISKVASHYPEDLTDRLRSLFLLETLVVDELDSSVAYILLQALHRLHCLSSVTVLSTEEHHVLGDFIASIPFPQQIRKLHILTSCHSLTQATLDRFIKLEELTIDSGTKFTDVHFCAGTLRRLIVPFCRCLDDSGLSLATELEVLDVSNCPKVKSVTPFAATLIELHAEGTCGIDDAALVDAVSIERLFVKGNTRVTTVKPFARRLRELDAFGSWIGDEGVKAATSIVQFRDNINISTVKPFAKTLRELQISDAAGSKMTDASLCDATGIVRIKLGGNSSVTTVKPFARTLRELDALFCKSLSDDGLRDATGIVTLNACYSRRITTLKPFAATVLEANLSDSDVTDSGLQDASSIVKLQITGSTITSVAPFARTLRVLHASSYGTSFRGINDAGLREATKISVAFFFNLPNVTTVKPFAAALWQLDVGSNCGLTDKSLSEATNLRRLRCHGRSGRITTITPFRETLMDVEGEKHSLVMKSWRDFRRRKVGRHMPTLS